MRAVLAAFLLPVAAQLSSLVGKKIPAIEMDLDFPPTKIDMAARVAGKKTIIVGLPGAFTPT